MRLLKLALCLSLSYSLGVAAFFVARDFTCPSIPDGFKRIKPGMTQAQVWELLEVPPGDYSHRAVEAFSGECILVDETDSTSYYEAWKVDSGVYEVHYTKENRVIGTLVFRNRLLDRQDSR